MEKKSSISMALSQEELLVVLSYLNYPFLLGLDLKGLQEAPEENVKLIFTVAERALVARGFLVEQDGKLAPASVVHAVVGACAAPDTTLVLVRQLPGKMDETYYFHTSRKMVVYHTIPVMGIHQFIALPDRATMTTSVFSLLGLGEVSERKDMSGIIAESDISEAQALAEEKGEAAALEKLSTTTLPGEVAQGFASALANQAMSLTLMHATDQQDGDRKGKLDGFTLVKGADNSLWKLTPENKDSAANHQVCIRLVSEADIAQKIRSMLKTGD